MNLELMAYLSDPERIWALPESYLLAYTEAAGGGSAPLDAAAPGSRMNPAGAIAVIGVNGPIAYRPNIFTALFGGSAVTTTRSYLRDALADESVSAIVMSFNTPGGDVTGITELASEIRAARGKKPIIAQVDAMAASAGYWLASSCDVIVATPSGLVGSIGVITAHVDESERLAKDGRKVTIISAGKYKSEGTSVAPLSDDALVAIQARVDEAYNVFVGDVAKGRNTKASDVRNGYGEGRCLSAVAAKAAGLIDRIATMDETLARLTGRRAATGLRADDDMELPADEPVEVPAALAVVVDVATEADRLRRLERF